MSGDNDIDTPQDNADPAFTRFIRQLTAFFSSVQNLGLAIVGAVGAFWAVYAVVLDGPGVESVADDGPEIVSPGHLPVLPKEDAGDLQCWQVNVIAPQKVPFALRYSLFDNDMAVSEPFHWLKMDVINECEYPLALEMRLGIDVDPASAPPGRVERDRISFTVFPGRQETRQVDPDISFQGDFTENIKLTIEWKAYKTKGDAGVGEYLGHDRVQITILPESSWVWDLDSPSGEKVKKEFLFAALAAWTSDKEKPVIEVRGRVDEKMSSADLDASASSDPGSYAAAYVRESMIQIRDNTPTRFAGRTGRFEPENTDPRVIDTPRRVLVGAVRSNDVELALAITAIVRAEFQQLGLEPVLVLYQNVVYLAWRDHDGRWGAVNLTDFIAAPGQAIEAQSSEDFIALLSTSGPQLPLALDLEFENDGDGVYLNPQDGLFALGMRRGAERYGILGMR